MTLNSLSASKLHEAILWVCGRLDQRNLVANHDGNVSARLPDGLFCVTPTARGKGELTSDDLIVIDADGKTIEGRGSVFSEWKIHAAIYKAAPDTQCVIHAHPPRATALGIEEKPLLIDHLPEAIVSLGQEIPCVPVIEPLSARQISMIEKIAPQIVAFLVSGNGVFARGHDLKTTYFRIELVEHLCSIYSHLGPTARRIPVSLREELLQKHRAYIEKCAAPFKNLTPTTTVPANESDEFDRLVQGVLRALEQ